MPKQQNQPTGRSKFRLLFIDGDLTAGDLQELTHAIAGAMRPIPITAKAHAPTRIASSGDSQDDQESGDDTEVAQDAEVSGAEVGEQVGPPKPPGKPRKYRSPKVVNDLDMKSGGKPFATFTVEKGNPSEQTARFLVAAYWLSEYAKMVTVSVDHIYTCYKSANWTFDVVDPGQPFRKLKATGMGDTSDGKFTINHLGISRVENMGKRTTN